MEIPEPAEYPQIAESLALKEPFDKLWTTAVQFQDYYDTWTKGPVLGLDAEVVAEEVTLHSLLNSYIAKGRVYLPQKGFFNNLFLY